ncbi:large conductance mechanosensitive channel protein MscL [bacterium]|nr:large conductance mechanosensitive channel protein MscL [bacterium]
MSFTQEFKQFAIKGNAVDLAVGVIIGGAFGKIVSSLVNDLIMPPLGKILGQVDFRELFIVLGDASFPTLAEAEKSGIPILKYGNFIQTSVDFLIIAFVIFLMVKWINKLKAKEEAKPVAPPTLSDEVILLQEIRDLLKAKS